MKITHTDLIAAGMPPWDVNKFRAIWPDGCEVTGENVSIADQHGLSAEVLFTAIATPELYNKYRANALPWSFSFLEAEIKEAQARLEELRREEQYKHLAEYIVEAMTIKEASK